MSYKGIEMTSHEDYIFSDTTPYNPEFDLEQLKIIQNKIENYTSGRSYDGITSQEAEMFLDWVTFNARSYATRFIPESAVTASMTGQCAPTQRINYELLSKMGLDVRAFNTADCIGEIPMSYEDIRKIQNGWDSTAVKHSISLVNIPIIDNNNNTQLYKFLLDPTFRQFCKRENCDSNKFVDQKWLNNGYVAPHVGYFMQADNLRQLGASEEVAQKSENLGRYIISKGYFYLNEENAKLYGDAFVRASKRLEFQSIPIEMSGDRYISNFENIPMTLLSGYKDDNEYTKLPSEIKTRKPGIFSRISQFFKEKFTNKKTLLLGEGNTQQVNTQTQYYGMEGIRLSEDELASFRTQETQILENYNNGLSQENTIEENGEREY